jgi:hypothetical protein
MLLRFETSMGVERSETDAENRDESTRGPEAETSAETETKGGDDKRSQSDTGMIVGEEVDEPRTTEELSADD